MTNATAMLSTRKEDLIKGVNEMIDAVTAPKKTKRPAPKAKAAPKPKAKATETVIEKAARNVKPEPVLFHGFEVAEGVDVATLEAEAKALTEACEAINRKDADLLASYLIIGKGAAAIAPMFKSTKLYGQFLAKEIPASQALDPALRSNCKWLFEALNTEGHEASDLLAVLGVNRIEDFKSGNPTVIKREYKAKKAEADKKAKLTAKAEAEGVDESEAEALLKAEAEAQAKKDQAAAKRKLSAMEKKIVAFLMQQEDRADMAQEAADLIRGILEAQPKEQLAFIESVVG